jgi:DnaJ-class molecular chaperone
MNDKFKKEEHIGQEPHKCPICYGRGNVSGGFYNGAGIYSVSDKTMETCRSCNGTGIIWS